MDLGWGKSVNIQLYPCTGKEFVGVVYKKGGVDIYYPTFYELQKTSPVFKDDLRSLLRLVAITKRSLKKSDVYNKRTHLFDFPLESYDWIWNHYNNNNRYLEKEIRYQKDGFGKVDWKKTFKQIPDIINDEFQYVSTINKSYKDTETIMTEIYNFCVRESYEKVQWMFVKNPPYICYEGKKITKSLLKKYKEVLTSRIVNTFNDDVILLLNHMLNIVCGCSEGLLDQLVFGVESFDVVFEKMVYRVLNNVDDISLYYPKAVYKNALDPNYNGTMPPMREDTIFIDEQERLYIVDSKYYCNTNPPIDSISKQIVYAQYVEHKHSFLSKHKPYKKDEIYNIFFKPKKHIEGKEVLSTDYTYAISEWNHKNKPYERILCVEVDLYYLIKNWDKNIDQAFQKDFVAIVHKFNNLLKQP